MPSTYTGSVGLEKPGSGEQSGTWGNTVNENMDMIDVAINGVKSLSLSSTSSTLTTNDGVISDGLYKVLVLGGTPSGTHTITLSPNTAQKIYLVNNTTAQTVVFTQGSGGNATISSGDTAVIYSTGAGAASAVVNLTNDLGLSSPKITGGTISGLSAPLAVADGGTGGATQSDARTGLGLGTLAVLNTGTAGGEVRTNTQNAATWQPLDATLTAYAGFAGAPDLVPYFTAADVLASMTVTSFARSFLDDVDAAAVRTTIGAQAAGSYVLASGDNLTGGFTSNVDDDGTFSTGTYTPTPVGGNFKTISNAGAFTLAAPVVSGAYNIVIQMTNASGAGAVTFTGFTALFGQSLTTIVSNVFRIHIAKIGSVITATVEGMQ
ncbi:MAG: hypothetical protein QM805_07700 [Pseudomonas sp.]